MSTQPVIVGIGEILWDVYPDGKTAGGAPINFVFHSVQMGAVGYAISAVGNDLDGKELLSMLEKNGVLQCIPEVLYPTGSVQVTLEKGNPSYDIVEQVAWDYIPMTQQMFNIVHKADAICFGSLAQRNNYTRDNIRKLIHNTREDSLRCFDINLRQQYFSKEVIESSLLMANVLKLNDEELEVIIPMLKLPPDHEAACKVLIERYNLVYLILTAGSRYSIVYGRDNQSHIVTPKVEHIVDTVGAGDSFLGAFIYSILTNKTLQEAHQKAVDVSAFICTQKGGWAKYEEKYG